MAIIAGTAEAKVEPYDFSFEDLAWIGRLIRVCAKIEDIISGYLCVTVGINHSQMAMLIGRTGPSIKLQIARDYTKARGSEAAALHRSFFDNGKYELLIQCRNAVAHGVLLGKIEDGRYAFLVNSHYGLEGDSVIEKVLGIDPQTIKDMCFAAEGIIPEMQAQLGIQDWMDRRNVTVLGPVDHLMGSKKRKSRPKPSSDHRLDKEPRP